MKKIYLLYPPISNWERYSSGLGNVGGRQIPLGIFFLAAFLRRNNYDVRVRDAEAGELTPQAIVEDIRAYSPNIIGISSTTPAFHRALEVAQGIKKAFPDKKIVLGGPHVTSNPGHAMSFEAFDFGVLGEGELTSLELFGALSDGASVAGICGLAYRKAERVVLTSPRARIMDLDSLPYPAYDLIENLAWYVPPPSNYMTLPVINMTTSRGCPSSCTFCDRSVFGTVYRAMSAKRIAEEVKHLRAKYGVREIAFCDDTFLVSKERIYGLFDLLRKEKQLFHWSCMARVNNVDYELLKFMKANGCWNIAFGIESGDADILKLIKKNIPLEKVRQVIDWCAFLGIRTKGFFIIGHPGETIRTIDKTIRFACDLKLDYACVTINTPMPGSLQYEQASLYGRLDDRDWAKFNCWNPVFVPHGLSEQILLRKQKEFYIKFYLRPRLLGRHLMSFFGKGGLRRLYTVLKLLKYLLP